MRLIVPIAGLLISALSIFLDLFAPPLASPLCRHGGCRSDQILSAVNAAGATPAAVSTLANADPANPLVWCTYAEIQTATGDARKAENAFDHAVSLGPAMPPVLMRAANFDFTHGRRDQGVLLVPRILAQTNTFDEILFSYLQVSGVPARTLLGTAIAATLRPAQSWLEWMRAHGSDQDLAETFTWMKANRLLDEKSAGEVAWTLWWRGSYDMSYALWSDWAGVKSLLANTNFATAPRETPFDWQITPIPAATVTRADGLEVRFTGAENVAYSGVRQFTVLPPGRYRFSADVESKGLTTDQQPFFHLFDPTGANRFSINTPAVAPTESRGRIEVDLIVNGKPQPVAIQLERRPSENFDNRIAGTLHIYGVSFAQL